MTLAAIFLLLFFLHSLVTRRLEQTMLTAPIIFTTAGMLTALVIPGARNQQMSLDLFLHIAEAGLVLLLFTDASGTDLTELKKIRALPARLLSTGILLTILLGGLAAWLIFPRLPIWEAGILAAILAPTDAGLGQPIVTSPSVPRRIRQALNVEAGLNDGLSVPFMLFFMALAGVGTAEQGTDLKRFMIEQLGYGILIGTGIGLACGLLFGLARRKGSMAESWQQLGVVAVPLLCAVVSEMSGASMFIAAFVAGLAVQLGFKDVGKHSVEFTESWGRLLNLSVFFFFGVIVARDWGQFHWTHLLYALVSLTVIRMVPVAVALIGTRLNRATVLFMGWFGPRGLASIVLALVYLRETPQSGESTIRLAVMLTVLLSIFAHGLTTLPGIKIYARRIAALGSNTPELEAGERLPPVISQG